MNDVIGSCGYCGGNVSIPKNWLGTIPPDATCETCGAKAKNPYQPVLEME